MRRIVESAMMPHKNARAFAAIRRSIARTSLADHSPARVDPSPIRRPFIANSSHWARRVSAV